VTDSKSPLIKSLSKQQVKEIYAVYDLNYVEGQADKKRINSGGKVSIEKFPNGFGRLIKQ
ncbi:MAG: hypothetical protein EBU90_28920, partial [Proteobacteria bacterium]|nr:hypothetical protein [Pseudomonadota bacterium]